MNETKVCTGCKCELQLSSFYKFKGGRLGVTAECKSCFCKRQRAFEAKPEVLKKKRAARRAKRNSDAEYMARHKEHGARWQRENRALACAKTARYRAAKSKAVPPWYDHQKVNAIYKKAAEYGFAVDHVVPLQGEIVCGLHTWENLQLVAPSLNSKKCNRFWPEMPDELSSEYSNVFDIAPSF